MKKIIAVLFVSLCFGAFAFCHEKPMNHDKSSVVHETWRVKFYCDKSCEDAADCGLQLTKGEAAALSCSCEGCQINTQTNHGINDEKNITQAKLSLLKKEVWKMMQIEIQQKHADVDVCVSSIDVALNHGQVLVFFNCLLVKEKKEVVIQVADIFM